MAESAQGPDLELICPCNYSAASSSSVNVSVGVLNRADVATGELILRAYAHTTKSYFDSDDREFLGELTLTTSLEGNSQLEITTFQGRLSQPPVGDYYVTILLLEDYFIQDLTRTDDLVSFGHVAAQSYSELYFVTDPSIEIDDDVLTLNMPGIGNSGSTDEVTEISLVATNEADLFSGDAFLVAEYLDVVEVKAGSASEPATLQFDFTSPPKGFDYYHLVVTDGDFTTLLHTVRAPAVEYEVQDFVGESVDFLSDSDGDGVADDNERIEGTDPGIGSSAPGKSYIDVLAVINTGVTSFYDGDASARLDHLFAVSNAALEDSEIDIILRLAGTEELLIDTSQDAYQWLEAANDGDGVFSELEQLRKDAGADLITMFRLSDGLNICGVATMGGYATQGLMTRTEHISATFIEFDECGDLTMIHEVGHNMGLGHSFRQNDTGTFAWSRGHGETGTFSTIMTYASEFDVFRELPYFSNPEVDFCEGSTCGVRAGQPGAADSASSLNAVRFQVAAFSDSVALDTDGDGVPDDADKFLEDATESIDSDGDGLGDNADYDDDNDGLPDSYEIGQGQDPLVDDGHLDSNNNGLTNLEDYLAVPRATQFLQTNSASASISKVHIVNTSMVEQNFVGTLFNGSGARLGSAGQSIGSAVAPKGRLVLTSDDLEVIFGTPTWGDPAMLEVSGDDSFVVMTKLESANGFVSNINCVGQDRSVNIEGFDSDYMTFVNFINSSNDPLERIIGTLYDLDGNFIGTANTELIESLAPKAQSWMSRNGLAELFGADWEGEAMLEVADIDGLKLLNVNFLDVVPDTSQFNNAQEWGASAVAGSYTPDIWSNRNTPNVFIVKALDGTLSREWSEEEAMNLTGATAPVAPRIEEEITLEYLDGQTSFNFSCFESSESGRVYLQTNSNSSNISLTHIVNTSDTGQQFTGTLFGSDGGRLGQASQPLHSGIIASKGRLILSSEMIEQAFSIGPWKGPAMLEVQGAGNFDLMTKLSSPSGLISNTNCARRDQVHNIGGADSPDMSFVRLINVGNQSISSIRGSLFDGEGLAIGAADITLLDGLGAKQQFWLNRNDLTDLFGGWNGEAMLSVEGGVDLRLLNLNQVNNETFFNFSCYEASN